MTMPDHFFLIRHGESEGNVAVEASKNGDDSHFTDEFVTTPGRMWALTDKGRAQAACAGEWLCGQSAYMDHSPYTRRHYVSPFTRTRQTAGHLGLVQLGHVAAPSVEWSLNRSLRERDWGDIETIPRSEFNSDPWFALSARKKQIDPLYWRPPGGESVCDVAENRVRNFLDTLHRECAHYLVVAVTHGEFIRATRLVLERADDATYDAWDRDPAHKIHNCEVVHYTRVVPDERFLNRFEKPGGGHQRCWPTRDRLTYMRRARPVAQRDGTFAMDVDDWIEIDHTLLTNDQLVEPSLCP